MFKSIVFLSLFLSLISIGFAQDGVDHNSYCCDGVNHCKPVGCEEISRDKNMNWSFKHWTIPKEHTYPSEDLKCYVCVVNELGTPTARCVYVPPTPGS